MATEAIVIVGAGAAGCTLSLLLARYGIRSTVVEQRTDTRLHPAAHVVNARTLEIWNAASPALIRALEAVTPPIDTVNVIRWCTNVHASPLGEIDLLSDPKRLAEVRGHSPFLISHIGQHLLMPALWEALDHDESIDFRRGWRADMTTGSLTLRPPHAVPMTASPRYVIAADGANSALRDAAGIAMDGPVLANMGSAFFHAPDLYPQGHDRPLLSWIYHPRFSGVMIAHADDDYVLMTPYLHAAQPIARDPMNYWKRQLPNVIGSTNYQIRSTGTWTMTSQLATTFRRGPLLLVGDAAHRFPHTGGFGLNSGVQDAHNLAWKLAAVFRSGAPDSLLDTYETERRPVVARFAEQSATNHFKLDEVTAPLGITNRSLHRATEFMTRPWLSAIPDRVMARVADGLTHAQTSRTKRLLRDDAGGRRLRRRMAEAIPGQLEHFVASGLEFGYAYVSPLIDTGIEGPCPDGDVSIYEPTTHPGARLPHTLVGDGVGGVRPLHDLIRDSGLTLFTADPRVWAENLPPSLADVPITVTALTPPGHDTPSAMLDLLEIGDRGAVVVRPDGHVVWRSRTGVDAVNQFEAFVRNAWAPLNGVRIQAGRDPAPLHQEQS
ncbi:putative monooxygenase [Mycolicibacterium madagascariense]|uniref:Putative monooxygenase n=1 Tax=Mycolicibacterium madagascariense TaxID=212765 RepID=A0A7I7XI97_9MYCO|nr:FAD-dependent monooxygenase [Mycolicibacterium madagascariense]MCV7010943.1 FAD-dependent monooxygenase [Mycolicibacterium madagascariense]BBZ28936.1 putative monooxygenase [Mycolicibacterium madagascariense]